MSYKREPQPSDTPLVNKMEFDSEADQMGQICGYVIGDDARKIERKYNKLKLVAKELFDFYQSCEPLDDELTNKYLKAIEPI